MKMNNLGTSLVVSGRRWISVPLSRSKAPTSFAPLHRRPLGTCCRTVHDAATGSHCPDDRYSVFRCAHSRNRAHSPSSFCWRRPFHVSPPQHMHPSSAGGDDFAVRAGHFGLASKDDVVLAAEDPSTVFLDVRSPPEIADAPFSGRPCVKIWCTMDDTSRLKMEAEQLMPDKDAAVVIFCAVGGRASVAKRCLEEMGYKNVLNAGGMCDLGRLQ